MINFSVPRSEQRKFERELKKYYKKSRKEFEHRVEYHTGQMERLQKKKAPTGSSGDLRDRIHQDFEAGRRGEIVGSTISEMSYSAAVEYGTRPHIIRVKNKKVLAADPRRVSGNFPISIDPAGDKYAIMGKKVRHPGTEPNPFMFPGWRKAQKDLLKGLREVFK